MKSSKSKKSEVDDISRETQRLVSDSHVHLPYHKPKQKSLKDFLNRQKISKECQVSITGSKKLLLKAWELIESKEKNVEKFYNEDCSQDENNVELSSNNDNIQDEKNALVNNDDDSNCDKDIILENKQKNVSESSDDEENDENNLSTENELSDNNASPLISDIDSDDDEINLNNKVNGENLRHKLNPNNFENYNSSSNDENEFKKSVVKQFIDDEAESESDCSSENEESIPNFIDESGDEEEFSKMKKRKVMALSDSDDENETIDDDSSTTDSKVLSTGLYETETDICTQQLMGLCSGQFQTQEPDAEENDEDFEDEFDSEVPQDFASTTNDDFDEMPKLTSVKELFKNDEDDFDASQNSAKNIENDDFDELAKITSVKNVFHDETDDSDDQENNVEKNKNVYNDEDMLKPTSAKDFFDDEAELSESDWSSDDEDHLIETIDKLEEEEGDQDKLDENIVKDGLDKIYMRQLLDDDQQQVTALKEMLLEDGDLYSDSSRKRKFQWDETDQNDAVFKKPLFSDNEDDDGDDVLSEDEKSGNWRKERFKRESFLSQQDDDEQYNHCEEESSDILQTSVSIVKKTHIVKYQKDHDKKISNNKCDEKNELNCEIINDNEKNTSTSITVITDTLEINNVKNSDFSEFQVTNISSKLNKTVKGSFMKHNNNSKMTNSLLYINKKPLIGYDEKKNGKYEDKNEIKSLNTITAKASSNPFAYLLRNDNKQEITNGVMNVDKKENASYLSKPVQSTNVELTQQIHQTKIHKPMNSILKQLE